MEVSGPETESELQLGPMPQLQKYQVLSPTELGWGLNPYLHSNLSCCSEIPNPLCYSGNSLIIYLFIYLFIYFIFVFLGPYPWHMEIARLGVESEL